MPHQQVYQIDVSERFRNIQSSSFEVVVGHVTVKVVDLFLNKTVSPPTSLTFLMLRMLIAIQYVESGRSAVLSSPPVSK
jgi:hypothetical protein